MGSVKQLTLATQDAVLALRGSAAPPVNMQDAVIWPLGLYCLTVVILVVALLGLSYLLGQRHRQRATGQPYESGMPATGTARMRFDVKFYLVALLFVVFDLEAVFLFAWAISVRELGWMGYIEVLVFVGVLLVALVYLWKSGALDWASSGRHRRRVEQTTQGDRP